MNALLLALFAVPTALAATAPVLNTVIHPNGNTQKCLDVQGNLHKDGALVDIYDCNGSGAQTWTLINGVGVTAIQLTGTQYCLDAGKTPGDRTQMKIWSCYSNLAAQRWSITADHNILLANSNLAVDLTDSKTDNGNIVQLYSFAPGNPNQLWTFDGKAPTPAPIPTPPATARQIHPNGNKGKCVDVKDGKFINDQPVQIYDCNGSAAQNWELSSGATHIKLSGTNFCLDAGSNPHSQGLMKIYDCYDNLLQQKWTYSGDNKIELLTNNLNQCLDLPAGSSSNGVQLQTYECRPGNTNQIWTL